MTTFIEEKVIFAKSSLYLRGEEIFPVYKWKYSYSWFFMFISLPMTLFSSAYRVNEYFPCFLAFMHLQPSSAVELIDIQDSDGTMLGGRGLSSLPPDVFNL